MKLESLKSSKFEAFKGLEVKNPLKVIGGQKEGTTYHPRGQKELSKSDMWYTDRHMNETMDRRDQFGEHGDMVFQSVVGGPYEELGLGSDYEYELVE